MNSIQNPSLSRWAAIHSDSDIHLLDHLCPLCHALQIPLYVTEEKIHSLAIKYYPQVTLHRVSKEDLSLSFLAQNFDVLFQSKFWAPHLSSLFSLLGLKAPKRVYCPHGNSDKGHLHPNLLDAYTWQDGLLFYGDHMKDFLQKYKTWEKIPYKACVGNYRYSFYLSQKEFYDHLVQEEVFSQIDPSLPTLLYAPTWKDLEDSTSFFQLAPQLIEELPDTLNLLIKPHPLLEERNPELFYPIQTNRKKPNILFLSDFPLVYPILERCDGLIGDFSSVGYDFLLFEKPMFFFDPHSRADKSHPSLSLHQCGLSLSSPDFPLITKHLRNWPQALSKKQREVYRYVFGEENRALRQELRSDITANLIDYKR